MKQYRKLVEAPYRIFTIQIYLLLFLNKLMKLLFSNLILLLKL